MKNSYTGKEQYYGDYLALDKILNAQFPESVAQNVEAHDEMLFIIIHQAYELWFKQISYEFDSVFQILNSKEINDNSESIPLVAHRLERVVEIWKLLVAQVKVLETMTPMDFLDFRDLLTPASGFQSFQFRILETRLGLKMDHRFEQKYYQKQLREEHIQEIEKAETLPSMFELLDKWLSRIPFLSHTYWIDDQEFINNYKKHYTENLSESDYKNLQIQSFDDFFLKEENRSYRLSHKAAQSLLFINLYRQYPMLQSPYRILSLILEIDELMASFRHKHIIMVRRMIGLRSGTGGSSGAGYLQGAMEKHQIFAELAGIATFLINRKNIPELSSKLIQDLSFGKH